MYELQRLAPQGANYCALFSIRRCVSANSDDAPPLITLKSLLRRQSGVHFGHDGDFGCAPASRRKWHEQCDGKGAGGAAERMISSSGSLRRQFRTTSDPFAAWLFRLPRIGTTRAQSLSALTDAVQDGFHDGVQVLP